MLSHTVRRLDGSYPWVFMSGHKDAIFLFFFLKMLAHQENLLALNFQKILFICLCMGMYVYVCVCGAGRSQENIGVTML